nr:hypothetical protein 1 [bacterium]
MLLCCDPHFLKLFEKGIGSGDVIGDPSSIEITTNYIYVGTGSGYLHQLNKETGEVNWSDNPYSESVEGVCSYGDYAFYNTGSSIRKMNLSGSYIWWSVPTSGTTLRNYVDGTNIYCTDSERYVSKYPENASGTINPTWRSYINDNSNASLCAGNEYVFCSDTQGNIVKFDSNGSLINSVKFTSSTEYWHFKRLRFFGGYIYSLSTDNKIRKIDSDLAVISTLDTSVDFPSGTPNDFAIDDDGYIYISGYDSNQSKIVVYSNDMSTYAEQALDKRGTGIEVEGSNISQTVKLFCNISDNTSSRVLISKYKTIGS